MKSIRISLLLMSIVVLLAACGPSATEEPASVLQEGEVCVANPDGQGEYSGKNPKSQSLSILGVPHGFFVYNEVQKQIEQFVEAAEGVGTSTTNVVILVVDVFSVEEVEEVPTPEPGVEPPDMGEFNASYPGHDWLKRIDYWESPAGSFTLVAVDTDELNTNSILQNMESAINLFASAGDVVLDSETSYPGADHIVVNMSFGYVPCDPMPYIETPLSNLGLELTDPEKESLEALREIYDDASSSTYAYVTGQWSVDHESLVEQLNNYPDPNNALFEAFITSLVYSPDDLTLDGDAFARFSNENAEWLEKIEFDQLADAHPGVVFIGAAGNFKLPYPLYPAAIGLVTSVSSMGTFSDESCRDELAEYSNCGEVKLDGVFLDEAGTDTGIEGTSFASPEFSFWVALHLLGNQLCPEDGNELSNGLADLNNTIEAPTWDNFDFPSNCLPP